ncbi:hypothetical protein [Nitrososphaera viennensis]|uniref:Uncharacterized protein n=2 Tax=Nitrososphaera viennensis TaxID=1034015 RepID=A0A060HPQ8_9ARCH|nr:hypothetical protein [Nitrososphaera viennensis]AIC17125.1 hypothetical protein NVIE_028510 [Nitrososphaera viennensis EN76]UVS69017.1 hypothetical protein NWT39_14065 [Nitrososphaera viennensis]
MPKRKIKEEKPKKRLGKKEMLIIPIIMGGATLVALLATQLFPPPDPTEVCLKNHNVETFQLFPRVEVIVDGQTMQLPDNVGKQPKDGQECLRPIHTDKVGNEVHIEYIRPVRLSMADFMRVYSYDNSTITVVNNSTGTNVEQVITLNDYNIQYSYFSEKNEFTSVPDLKSMPAFTNEMVVRAELTHK